MTNPVFDTSARGRSSRALVSAHERRSSARAELERRSRALVSAHERRSSATSARALGERSYERFNVDFSARCAHMSARSARALLVLLLPINRSFRCSEIGMPDNIFSARARRAKTSKFIFYDYSHDSKITPGGWIHKLHVKYHQLTRRNSGNKS